MSDYPKVIAPVNHIEPVPRRIRAVLAGEVVLNTTAADLCGGWPRYPQHHIPLADVRAERLVDSMNRSSAAAPPSSTDFL